MKKIVLFSVVMMVSCVSESYEIYEKTDKSTSFLKSVELKQNFFEKLNVSNRSETINYGPNMGKVLQRGDRLVQNLYSQSVKSNNVANVIVQEISDQQNGEKQKLVEIDDAEFLNNTISYNIQDESSFSSNVDVESMENRVDEGVEEDHNQKCVELCGEGFYYDRPGSKNGGKELVCTKYPLKCGYSCTIGWDFRYLVNGTNYTCQQARQRE